jgi:hypothetical protein
MAYTDIDKASEYFNTVNLWTGTGSSAGRDLSQELVFNLIGFGVQRLEVLLSNGHGLFDSCKRSK